MDTVPTSRPSPPRAWEILGFALLVTIAATAGLGGLFWSAYLALWQYIKTNDEAGPGPVVELVLRYGVAVETVYLLLSVTYFLATAVWWWRTKGLLARFGRTDVPVMHWAVAGWALLLGLSFVAATAVLADPTPGAAVLSSIASLSLRVPALALLIYGLWQVRRLARAAVAEWGVPPAPRPDSA